MHKIIPFIAISLTQLTAEASTVVGNPNTSVHLVEGPNVYVVGLVAYRCSTGTQVLTVGAVLAKGDSRNLEFDEDEFCAIDVYVKWTPGGATVAVPVDGFDVFKAVDGGATVAIELDSTAQAAELN